MSKSLRNYPDVSEVFDRDGADAMRWYLMSSSVIRGGNLVVTEEGIREGVRQLMLPLWNSYYFFTLYANAAGPEITKGYTAVLRTDSTDVLDRYLLAKTRQVVGEVTLHLDNLDSPLAANALRDFGDVLTNWYVRRSRGRFWSGEGTEAFDTLYTVLETLARLAAPLLPLIAEKIWKGLTGGRSVHLTDWPDAASFPQDDALVATMDRVREIASSGLGLRKATGLRVRLPLAELIVVAENSGDLRDFSDILRDELNVKAVAVRELGEESLREFGIQRRLTVNSRAAGPRIGQQVQRVIQAAKAGDWTPNGENVIVGGIELLPTEFELQLQAADDAQAITFLPGGGFVLLDTVTTWELEAEGLARDLIRAVQDTRKAAGFQVSDRIDLTLYFESSSERAGVEPFEDTIAEETLALEISVVETDGSVEAYAAQHGQAGAFRSLIRAGQYANSGDVLVEVTIHGVAIDV
jgi:isoleucyl-tRNA synthetase